MVHCASVCAPSLTYPIPSRRFFVLSGGPTFSLTLIWYCLASLIRNYLASLRYVVPSFAKVLSEVYAYFTLCTSSPAYFTLSIFARRVHLLTWGPSLPLFESLSLRESQSRSFVLVATESQSFQVSAWHATESRTPRMYGVARNSNFRRRVLAPTCSLKS